MRNFSNLSSPIPTMTLGITKPNSVTLPHLYCGNLHFICGGWGGQWGKLRKGLSFAMYEVNYHMLLMTRQENN